MNVMASGQISSAAIKYIDMIFTGASKEKLEKSIKDGKIVLENLKFKENFFENLFLFLPFKVLDSQINSIEVEVPWSKLTSKSVEVLIQDININLLFNEKIIFDVNQKKIFEEIFYQKFSKEIFKKIEKMHDELEKAFADKKESAFLGNMIKTMVKSITDNLKIKVRNINFRIFNKIKNFKNNQIYAFNNNVLFDCKEKVNDNTDDSNLNDSRITKNYIDDFYMENIKEFIHVKLEEFEFFNTDKKYNFLVFDEKNKKTEIFYKLISFKSFTVDYYSTNIFNLHKFSNINKERKDNNKVLLKIDLLNIDDNFYAFYDKFPFLDNLNFSIKINYILPKLNEIKTTIKCLIDIPQISLNISNSSTLNLFVFISEINQSLDIIKNTINFNVKKYNYISESEYWNSINLTGNKLYEFNFNNDFINNKEIIKSKKEKLKFLFDFILHKIKQKRNNYLLVKTYNKVLEEEIKKDFFTLIQNRIFKKTNNDEKKDIDLLMKLFLKKLKFINEEKLLSWIGSLLESNLQKIKIVSLYIK